MSAARNAGNERSDDELLLQGPNGSIGPLLTGFGDGWDTRIRIGTLARLMRIERPTLWRQCTRAGLVGRNGLVRVGDVRALSEDYERRLFDLIGYAQDLRNSESQSTEARLERIEKAIDTIGAALGLHPWSACPLPTPPRPDRK